MCIIWERAAHSFNRMFSLNYVFFVIFVISHFGFVGKTLVLIAPLSLSQLIVIIFLFLQWLIEFAIVLVTPGMLLPLI